MSLCSFPCVARPFACASFVAISALECFLFLAVAACIRILPMLLQIFIVIINMINMTNMRVGGYVVPRITCPKFIRATKIDDTQCCGARGARSMGQPADMVASCCETGPMSGQLSVAHHTITPSHHHTGENKGGGHVEYHEEQRTREGKERGGKCARSHGKDG